MDYPIVITGLGVISPLGETLSELLEGLDHRHSGFSEISSDPRVQQLKESLSIDVRGSAARVGAFDVAAYVPPMKARRLDRASLLAVVAARQALEDAGLWPLEGAWSERLGVLLGTASAGSGPLTDFLRVAFTTGPSMAPPAEFPNTVANAPASQVSILNKITGPNTTLSQKQSVVGPALQFSQLWLNDGRCDAVLVGASDEWNPYYQLGYQQLGALRSSPDPTGQNGFLLGEGATVLVAESSTSASRRGANEIARLLGVGNSSSPGSTYQWVADCGAMRQAIRQALSAANSSGRDVTSVLVNANGVAPMERTEYRAISKELQHSQYLVAGIKGAIGESSASAFASVAVAAACRQRGVFVPHANGALSKAQIAEAAGRFAGSVAEEAQAMPDGSTLVLTPSAGGNYAAVILG